MLFDLVWVLNLLCGHTSQVFYSPAFDANLFYDFKDFSFALALQTFLLERVAKSSFLEWNLSQEFMNLKACSSEN